MAHIRKDTFVKPLEWAKHLRPPGKRQQAKRERRASDRRIRAERNQSNGSINEG